MQQLEMEKKTMYSETMVAVGSIQRECHAKNDTNGIHLRRNLHRSPATLATQISFATGRCMSRTIRTVYSRQRREPVASGNHEPKNKFEREGKSTKKKK